MRVGLVGVGRFGRRYLQTLAGLPELSLVAVTSGNPATAALLPPGCALHSDWRAMLQTPDLDGVLVVTPPDSHAEIVATAIRQGLAVLVEKPLTLDLAEAEALLALPRRVPVMVEHTQLFTAGYRMLRAGVAAAGVSVIEVDAGGNGPWRQSVPVMWDWGAHWVAVCLDLCGRLPARCEMVTTERRTVDGGIGETLVASLMFDNGTEAHLRLSNLLDAPRRVLSVLAGDGQTWRHEELAENALTVCVDDQPPRVVPVSGPPPLTAALLEFHDVWRNWCDTGACAHRSGLELGVDVVRVLGQCSDAAA